MFLKSILASRFEERSNERSGATTLRKSDYAVYTPCFLYSIAYRGKALRDPFIFPRAIVFRPPSPGIARFGRSCVEAGDVGGLEEEGGGWVEELDLGGGEGFGEGLFQGAGFGAEEGAGLCVTWERGVLVSGGFGKRRRGN
jgi:hypothetical protein